MQEVEKKKKLETCQENILALYKIVQVTYSGHFGLSFQNIIALYDSTDALKIMRQIILQTCVDMLTNSRYRHLQSRVQHDPEVKDLDPPVDVKTVCSLRKGPQDVYRDDDKNYAGLYSQTPMDTPLQAHKRDYLVSDLLRVFGQPESDKHTFKYNIEMLYINQGTFSVIWKIFTTREPTVPL